MLMKKRAGKVITRVYPGFANLWMYGTEKSAVPFFIYEGQ